MGRCSGAEPCSCEEHVLSMLSNLWHLGSRREHLSRSKNSAQEGTQLNPLHTTAALINSFPFFCL